MYFSSQKGGLEPTAVPALERVYILFMAFNSTLKIRAALKIPGLNFLSRRPHKKSVFLVRGDGGWLHLAYLAVADRGYFIFRDEKGGMLYSLG
jgi:hypothetical protein